MGVFNCPDCGGKVSDRAAKCPHCGAPARPGLPVNSPIALIGGDPNAEVCLTCHSLVHAVAEAKGPAWIGWVLLPFYLLPGIIYFIWRSRSRRPVCPRCNGETLVPARSARGAEIMAATAAAALPGSTRYYDCPECMLPVSFPGSTRALPCPHCTTPLTLTDTGVKEA